MDLVQFNLVEVPNTTIHQYLNHPTKTDLMLDVGAMIAFVKAATNREPELVVGKPNRLIVDAAALKMNLPVEQLAMIGDRL